MTTPLANNCSDIRAPLHTRASPYVFLALTGLYLVVEAAYNIGLVRMLSSPSTTRATVEGMEVIGKSLAAFGVSLAIVRFLPAWRVRIFVMLCMLLYVMFGAMIDAAISALPPSLKVEGHYLGLYRVAVVQGEIKDDEIGKGSALPETARRLATTNVALIGLDSLGGIQRKVRAFAESRFRTEVKRAFSEQDFERLWEGYSTACEKLRPFWERYKGKQVPFWNPLGGQVMDDTEHGRLVFLQAIKLEEVRKYRATSIYGGNAEYGIPALSAGDIPPFMTREELKTWINRFVANGKTKVMRVIAPTESEIGASGASHLTDDLSSSVFVPPISMSLSLFSLTLNSISFIATCLALIFSFVMPRRTAAIPPTILQALAFLAVAAVVVPPLSHSPSPFPKGSEFERHLVRASQGSPALVAWASAIRMEGVAYGVVSHIPRMTEFADSLPNLGGK